MSASLSEAEILRYSRHILLPEIGGTGQMALRNASALIVGAGGLGSPVALYLAAAGIGRLGIVDNDRVELSNLQRQIVHRTDGIGSAKVESAAATLAALNPEIRIEPHNTRLSTANARSIIREYDIVCDGSDNFTTRLLVNEACVQERRTLISAAVLRFEGQLSTFRPHRGGPCYHCLYPAPAAGVSDADAPSCGDAGIFGAVTGVMGTLQATEALKEVLDIGESMAGRLLIWDALATRFHSLSIPRDPNCTVCGPAQRADGVAPGEDDAAKGNLEAAQNDHAASAAGAVQS